MNKSKILGILMISSAIILIVLVIGYTVLFSIFGISSGGSVLMITPLLIIAIVLIIALSLLLYAGIKKLKNKK
jgi:predicted anti-sigma-YlaC factor YlaD